MPGRGDTKAGCGDFYTSYCSVDMGHTNGGKGIRGLHECKNRNCPWCATDRRKRRGDQEDPDDGLTEEDRRDLLAAEPGSDIALQISSKRLLHELESIVGPGGPIALTKEERILHSSLDRKLDLGIPDPEENPQRPAMGAWLRSAIRTATGQVDYAFRLSLAQGLPKGNGRLDSDGHRMDLRWPRTYHIQISVQPRPFGYTRAEERAVRKKLIKRLCERGMRDFKMWMHPFRHDDSGSDDQASYAKQGLHYHVLGVSRWVMFGELKRAGRGRPAAPKDPARTLHAFDGKHWGPLRSRRVPVPPSEAVWKVIWFAQPVGRTFFIRHLSEARKDKIVVKTSAGLAAYLQRVVGYLFHHCGFYNAFYVPDEERYGRMTFKRVPGRHATPSVMAYGACRMPPQQERREDPLWSAIEAAWGSRQPKCDVCGAPMTEVYDEPDGPAACQAARIRGDSTDF